MVMYLVLKQKHDRLGRGKMINSEHVGSREQGNSQGRRKRPRNTCSLLGHILVARLSTRRSVLS